MRLKILKEDNIMFLCGLIPVYLLNNSSDFTFLY